MRFLIGAWAFWGAARVCEHGVSCEQLLGVVTHPPEVRRTIGAGTALVRARWCLLLLRVGATPSKGDEDDLLASILFFTPYYPPEMGAPKRGLARRRRLVKRGHQVTVLTTLPTIPWRLCPRVSSPTRAAVRDGVSVVRVWSYISPNKGFLRRILSQLSFGLPGPVPGLAGTLVARM